MACILIVEDEKLLNQNLAAALQKQGHRTLSAFTFFEARCILERDSADLVLLDIGLPDRSGLELCRLIRQDRGTPIIFLTANDTEQDMLAGFEAGCDDYISKPFSLALLRRRIEAVLRRTAPSGADVFIHGPLRIDFEGRTVRKNGKNIALTATEYKLLELLARGRGQILTRRLLLERMWDEEGNFVDENALSVNIRRLRKKIEDDPQKPAFIVTVFGIGYTFGEKP